MHMAVPALPLEATTSGSNSSSIGGPLTRHPGSGISPSNSSAVVGVIPSTTATVTAADALLVGPGPGTVCQFVLMSGSYY